MFRLSKTKEMSDQCGASLKGGGRGVSVPKAATWMLLFLGGRPSVQEKGGKRDVVYAVS